jgi:leucyl-tRNA synthetase
VIDLVVQVNGKTRGTVKVPRGSTEDAAVARAMTDPTVQRFVTGKEVRKRVFVKDRLLNLVLGA